MSPVVSFWAVRMRALAAVAVVIEGLDLRVPAGEALEYLAAAVGGAVVDDYELPLGPGGGRLEDPPHDRGQGGALVVAGHYDAELHGAFP